MDSLLDRWLSGDKWSVVEAYAQCNAEIRAKADAQYATERLRQEAWDARCNQLSSAVAAMVAPFIAVLKQVRIACSYGWALVKAQKQGACPFLRFQD